MDKLAVLLPDFHLHPWAMEYLSLLGIRANQVLDGGNRIVIPPHGKLVLGTGPSSAHGIAHPTDIAQLIKLLAPVLPPPPAKPWRRLYISRKMGRMMANERDLVAGLLARNFELIRLEDLPLMEQIRLFQEASYIVGPHGAGHANIMWSAPGTRILEVFHPSWMHPCYALLAKMRGIGHHSLVGFSGSSKGTWTPRSRFGIFEDPAIHPDVFFRKIDQIDRS
jgi:capsular polysaccharide biosynthesis protein